jgi:hypothetical protein
MFAAVPVVALVLALAVGRGHELRDYAGQR